MMLALPQASVIQKVVMVSLLLLSAIYLLNCFGQSRVMAVDAVATKSEVLKDVPVGTPIERARSFMSDQGFKCSAMKNRRYADEGPDHQQIDRGPADILWCDSGERMTWSFLISKRWQVIFEDDIGKVSYIAASVGVTGP